MKDSFLKRAAGLYRDGFRDMPAYARKLWMIIIIKLVLLLLVFRLFLMDDFLGKNFDNDSDRAKHVIEELTR
ncbi:MAG: DUF4492 domain-containing protein [Bacteroidales bacterium]|nr:DUF4492 domain-containing protein [Bacteroidales bacterium]